MRLHPRVRHTLIPALILALLPAACDDAQPTPRSQPSEMAEAMVLDGIAIEKAAILSWEDYLKDLEPTTGRFTRMRYLLDRHLIPMAFARQQFAEERAKLRANAEGMAKALGDSAGYDALVQAAEKFSGAEFKTGVLRAHLPLPEARWLFEDENVGRVSPVLETAQGFSLVAASDKKPGLTKAFDTVDAILVRFYTHKSIDHAKWSERLKQRLGSLAPDAIKVHPDFQDALPRWPKPPK